MEAGQLGFEQSATTRFWRLATRQDRQARCRPMVRGVQHDSTRGANSALLVFRQIMNHAVARGHIETNPTRGVKRNSRPKLTRFLSREEIGRLHEVLDHYEARWPSSKVQADIIRLLLMTGCRKSEVLNLRWRDVQVQGHQDPAEIRHRPRLDPQPLQPGPPTQPPRHLQADPLGLPWPSGVNLQSERPRLQVLQFLY